MSGKSTKMATLDKYDFIQCRLLKICMTLSITISVAQTHETKRLQDTRQLIKFVKGENIV